MFYEEPTPPEPERPQIDTVELGIRADKLEDALKTIGLYMQGWEPAPMLSPSGKPIMVVNCMIGDIAFSDRVQNPDKVKDDKQITAMDLGLRKEELAAKIAQAKAYLEDE